VPGATPAAKGLKAPPPVIKAASPKTIAAKAMAAPFLPPGRDDDGDEEEDKLLSTPASKKAKQIEPMGFAPMVYQAAHEDFHSAGKLVVIALIPNGITNLRVDSSDDGDKLFIRGTVPKVLSRVDKLIEDKLLVDQFEIKAIEDALMAYRHSINAPIRVLSEIQLKEAVVKDSMKLEATVDPDTHAHLLVIRMNCACSDTKYRIQSSIAFRMMGGNKY
jgi:hypothetical protein